MRSALLLNRNKHIGNDIFVFYKLPVSLALYLLPLPYRMLHSSAALPLLRRNMKMSNFQIQGCLGPSLLPFRRPWAWGIIFGCIKGKTFCERPSALNRQQFEKDKQNVPRESSPRGKFSADAHAESGYKFREKRCSWVVEWNQRIFQANILSSPSGFSESSNAFHRV